MSVKNPVDINHLPICCEEQKFEGWTIKSQKSHILSSKCTGTTSNGTCVKDSTDECQFCRYNRELSLPHLPDMVFAKNVLILKHQSGPSICLNPLEALKRVAGGKLNIKIACADAWKESRQDTGLTDREVEPFDWTFSTDYNGTLEGNWTIEPTDLRIDLDRLRQKESILFYDELNLFEDELHDNGIATLSVKIRVMPSGFFILMRYFLRVDSVMVRVNDTRYYHDFTTDFVLREFTTREEQISALQMPLSVLTDPNQLAGLLPTKVTCYEKLSLPTVT